MAREWRGNFIYKMKRNHINQTELGAELGISQAEVSHVLSGKNRLFEDVYRQRFQQALDAIIARRNEK